MTCVEAVSSDRLADAPGAGETEADAVACAGDDDAACVGSAGLDVRVAVATGVVLDAPDDVHPATAAAHQTTQTQPAVRARST
jgi:hypothetical protein